MSEVLAFLFGYLLGSIPFGLVIVRAAGLGDVRSIGSGNIGATNVLRTGRKELALATLLLDAGKGGIAVVIAGALTGWSPLPMALAGAGAFLGHCFPVWLRFHGGKGIATYLGTALAFDWRVALILGLVWLAAAKLTRYSSMGGLSATSAAPFLFWWLAGPPFALAAAFMTVIVFYRHRANIARLRAGTEPKVGEKKAKA